MSFLLSRFNIEEVLKINCSKEESYIGKKVLNVDNKWLYYKIRKKVQTMFCIFVLVTEGP